MWRGIRYGSIIAKIDEQQKDDGYNTWITMTMCEGKNREIRNVMEATGYQVSRLLRLSYGPFELGELGRGEVMEVTTRTMKEQLPPEIAAKILT